MSTIIYLVEHAGTQRAFRNKTDAWEFAKDKVLDAFEGSGLSEEDLGIDITRLAGPGSLPADWFELTVQWNEFWDCQTEDRPTQVLIYEIPLD